MLGVVLAASMVVGVLVLVDEDGLGADMVVLEKFS